MCLLMNRNRAAARSLCRRQYRIDRKNGTGAGNRSGRYALTGRADGLREVRSARAAYERTAGARGGARPSNNTNQAGTEGRGSALWQTAARDQASLTDKKHSAAMLPQRAGEPPAAIPDKTGRRDGAAAYGGGGRLRPARPQAAGYDEAAPGTKLEGTSKHGRELASGGGAGASLRV